MQEEISIEVISGANINLLEDMYVFKPEKDAYRTAFKFADSTGMGFLSFEKARVALTTAGIHAEASKVEKQAPANPSPALWPMPGPGKFSVTGAGTHSLS